MTHDYVNVHDPSGPKQARGMSSTKQDDATDRERVSCERRMQLRNGTAVRCETLLRLSPLCGRPNERMLVRRNRSLAGPCVL